MTGSFLLFLIVFPVFAGGVALLLRGKHEKTGSCIAIMAAAVNLAAVIVVFGKTLTFVAPWAGFGMNFSLRLDAFAGFIILSAAVIGLLVAFYSFAFMAGRTAVNQFYAYLLLTLGFANGAVLASNLVVLLFFWEGLLLTLFAMIWLGNPAAFRTARKAFIITAVADLCLMSGIALLAYVAGSLEMAQIHGLPLQRPAAVAAFILLVIGATAKGGVMPFHTWIPDAALDAPAPFMALLPAALEKLLGIYLLTRITLDIFSLQPSSWLSTLLMIVGSATILLAVLMALVQKDYKRLLAFHAISQLGYMILGIGTAVPVGIVGGIFHMVNNAIYKCCLFLTGASVERQVGTTDLRQLGGLASRMPVTFGCFLVAAVSICGVPLFNGFFSKELVYDAAWERGWIYYAAALAGSFFTAASFLKLGHAAYKDPAASDRSGVNEAPFSMLAPMVVLAAICIVFGIYNPLPLRYLIQPALGDVLQGHDYAGLPHSWGLAAASIIVLAGAVVHHAWGVQRWGAGLKAVDHIHHAPILARAYDLAEARCFDLYEIGLRLVETIGWLAWLVDRIIDLVYELAVAGLALAASFILRAVHSGSHARYAAWALAGAGAILWLLLRQA